MLKKKKKKQRQPQRRSVVLSQGADLDQNPVGVLGAQASLCCILGHSARTAYTGAPVAVTLISADTKKWHLSYTSNYRMLGPV